MKKIVISHLFLIILLAICFRFFVWNYKIVTTGIDTYNDNDFREAMDIFDKGYKEPFTLNKENLLYNIARAAYNLQQYYICIEYIKYYRNKDAYLMRGNCLKKIADSSNDFLFRYKHYQLALSEYKQGIREHPGEEKLVYNYEYLKKIIVEYKEIMKKSGISGGNSKQNEREASEDPRAGLENLPLLRMIDFEEKGTISENFRLGTGRGKKDGEYEW